MISTDIYYSNFEDRYPEYAHLSEDHKTLMYYCILANKNDNWAIAHIDKDNDIKVICYLISVYKNELERAKEESDEECICKSALRDLKLLLIKEISRLQSYYLI